MKKDKKSVKINSTIINAVEYAEKEANLYE